MRSRAMRYTTTFIAPVLAVFGLLGHGWWCWALPIHAFVLVPLVELLLGPYTDSLSEEEEQAALADPLYDILIYLLVPMQWALLVLFLFRVGEPGITPSEVAGRVATMGILCGIYGINVAHELGHRAKRWERDLARALLLTSLYMHFIIEHNRGHHRRVATAEDPASARYGETIYAFWLRTIIFSWRSAWHIEADRLRKAGERPFGLKNEMLHLIGWQLALLVCIGAVFGLFTLGAFCIAALIGALLLETVNYIEHYGLRRKRGVDGGYARVKHVHSWNSDHLLGRLMLFELTRHSDHHYKASRKYQVLRTLAEAPQLPTGYPGMMMLSLVPPLFFRVTHPLLAVMVDRDPDLELAA
ncbi:MAG: alkane 1-monooxygenase [Flavobacteriales bacterium]